YFILYSGLATENAIHLSDSGWQDYHTADRWVADTTGR
ncbi:unnamed protein product, partial [marine sediment metagenome]